MVWQYTVSFEHLFHWGIVMSASVFVCEIVERSQGSRTSSLVDKLLAVWHTTGQQIARTSGANAAQFLYVEGGSFVAFALISLLAICLLVPLNLYAGTVPMEDQFSKTTVSHIKKGSPLLWVHVLFMVVVVTVVHYCIRALEVRLNATRFHDGNFSVDSVSVYTLMIQGIPKILDVVKRPLPEYFEERYLEKVHRVIVPPDLASLDDLVHCPLPLVCSKSPSEKHCPLLRAEIRVVTRLSIVSRRGFRRAFESRRYSHPTRGTWEPCFHSTLRSVYSYRPSMYQRLGFYLIKRLRRASAA